MKESRLKEAAILITSMAIIVPFVALLIEPTVTIYVIWGLMVVVSVVLWVIYLLRRSNG